MNSLLAFSSRAGLTAYYERLDRAREIDPEAFKPTMIPHYTPEQLNRQRIALDKANDPKS